VSSVACVSFVEIFTILQKNNILKNSGLSVKKNSVVLKKLAKKPKKIATLAYNMKGCLRFFYFHILNVTKLG
jgi:hypothetical protein